MVERRTQAERTAATRRALVDAAIELLVERGWAATTAVAVCERAGCTRGALVHHFPTLSSLLAHALEELYADLARFPRPPLTSVVDAIDAMWAAMGDPRFKAVLEAWSAAGNDPELALELAPVIGRFAKLVSPDNARSDSPLATAEARTVILVAREAMLGLATGRATNGGRPLPHETEVLAWLRSQAADA